MIVKYTYMGNDLFEILEGISIVRDRINRMNGLN